MWRQQRSMIGLLAGVLSWLVPMTVTSFPFGPTAINAQATAASSGSDGGEVSRAEPPAPAPRRDVERAGSPGGAPAASVVSRPADWSMTDILLIASAAVLLMLGVATCSLFYLFKHAIARELPLGTRGHWGGFGGTSTGWDLSPALALLVSALFLAAITAGFGSALVGAVSKPSERSSPAPTGGSTTPPSPQRTAK